MAKRQENSIVIVRQGQTSNGTPMVEYRKKVWWGWKTGYTTIAGICHSRAGRAAWEAFHEEVRRNAHLRDAEWGGRWTD